MNRLMLASVAILFVAAAFASPRHDSPVHSAGLVSLITASDMVAEPGGNRVTMLPVGARVQIIERQGDWIKVNLTGWVPASAAGAVEQPAVGAQGSLSGSVFITGARGRTHVGSGTAILLLRDPAAATDATRAVRASCEPDRNRLRQEADYFSGQAARAIRTIENTTKAFDASDEAKRQRSRLLVELAALDEACDARESAALAPFVIARALTTPEGRFIIRDVPPGPYILIASFEAEKSRHSWEARVEILSGVEGVLDLTNGNRAGQSTVPDPR